MMKSAKKLKVIFSSASLSTSDFSCEAKLRLKSWELKEPMNYLWTSSGGCWRCRRCGWVDEVVFAFKFQDSLKTSGVSCNGKFDCRCHLQLFTFHKIYSWKVFRARKNNLHCNFLRNSNVFTTSETLSTYLLPKNLYTFMRVKVERVFLAGSFLLEWFVIFWGFQLVILTQQETMNVCQIFNELINFMKLLKLSFIFYQYKLYFKDSWKLF